VDTGWLLVGGAGVAGGLALVLVGAGIATAPLLLPVGALLAVVAYLAWAAGTSHIVASVYDGVDDPGRSTADGRTGRPEDRVDPDGNWRSTAADGGRTAGPDAGATGGVGGPGAGAGLGPDDEPIWDATERDRAGGWDDWEAHWEWSDRHWNEFRRGHDGDRTGNTGSTGRGGRGQGRSGRRTTRGDDGRTGDRGGRRHRERTDTGSRQRAHGGESSRRRRRGDRRRGRTRRRDGQARRARDLLEVDPDASEEALRTAYRERVKEVHPDRGGDPEQFKRVQWAYEYLSEG
jgi:DnaJ-domain-containing protein 1